MMARKQNNKPIGCLVFVILFIVFVFTALFSTLYHEVKAKEQTEYHAMMQAALEDTTAFQATGEKAVTYKDGTYTTQYVPKKLVAKTADEVRYILYAESGKELIGYYSNGGGAANHYWVKITVKDLSTGEDIGSEQFWGPYPPTTKSERVNYETQPDDDEISTWFLRVLDGTAQEPLATENASQVATHETEPELTTDPKEEAVDLAITLLSGNTGFSASTLKEWIIEIGFTEAEAEYAIENCNADWMGEAVKCAFSLLEQYSDITDKEDMVQYLESNGFTHEQAIHGAEQVGY